MPSFQFQLWEDITDRTSRRFFKAYSQIRSCLMSDPESICRLEFSISSNGGEVEPGLAIYDMLMDLKKLGCQVTTVVYGKAYSCAALLLLTGHARVCTPNSIIMFHPISFGMPEDYITHQASGMEMTAKMDAKVLSIYTQSLNLKGKKLKEFKDKLEKTLWMSADEAVSEGVVHQIGFTYVSSD